MNPLLIALIQAGTITKPDADRISRQLDDTLYRQWAETELLTAWQGALQGQQGRALDVLRGMNGEYSDDAFAAFWDAEDAVLWPAVRESYLDVASETSTLAAVQMGVGDSTWNMVNENVISWVDDYYTNPAAGTFGSVPNLNLTSRQSFGDAFKRWERGEIPWNNGEGLPALINELTPVFGPERAERIAVTETTRVISESRQAAAQADPFAEFYRLLTAADELVCPICGPLQDQIIPKSASGFDHPSQGQIGFPPFHVRCRCDFVTETAASIAVTEELVEPWVYDPEVENG